MSPPPTNRRALLRRFAGEAVGLAGAPGRLKTGLGSPEQPASSTEDPPDARPVVAAPTRTPTIAEIEAAAAQVGVVDRTEHVRRLLVRSFRLIPREGDAVRGTAWRPQDVVGAPIVRVSLPEPAASASLTCIRERPGYAKAPAAPYAIRVGGAPDLAEGLPIELSTEFVLPRAWSSAVQALDLNPAELVAWEALRGRLAELHELPPPDALIAGAAIHRVLGYPDETTGSMPLACAMLAGGVELGDIPPFAHPEAEKFEPEAVGWRLLLQLSRDDALGWSWGPREERLYIWIHRERLASGNFEDMLALVQ